MGRKTERKGVAGGRGKEEEEEGKKWEEQSSRKAYLGREHSLPHLCAQLLAPSGSSLTKMLRLALIPHPYFSFLLQRSPPSTSDGPSSSVSL